ncbi:Gmad2 immunoglobulin-like domain-containing protein [Nocardia huaxiensis]|uniref:Gmad2 immunoglobulin-like domain-containing protein n=1 Tax=Nocardia huaxiensis TaxID=2755382 RepID=UPI001FD45B05|nr:Gmad2 immunoglobulin-like domain-containing protein [Nocardia huaxiensis]
MSNNSDAPGRRTGPVITLVLAAVAVLLAVASLAIALTRDRDDGRPHATVTLTQAVPATTGPGMSAPTTRDPSATSGPTTVPNRFTYQPLWPFANESEAAAWQRAYREGGHQPWHLDPAAVAADFTRNYLGFATIDKIVLVTTEDEEAWVTVGYDNPNGVPAPAAMLHLVRLGSGDDAPWEVVGSEDRTLTITTPRYGAQVGSPFTVGGRITGVDESLDIRLLQLPNTQPVGEVGQIPAGGTDSPWTATVPFAASCPGTLTLVVATGGHVAEVEKFAITAVRC